jgi:hypothetical protein
MPYSTPTDVTNILNITFSSTTVPTVTQVTDLIARGDSYIDRVSGHNWYLNQAQEYYEAIGSGPRAGLIVLRNRPLIQVLEAAWWYGGIKAWMPGLYGYPEQSVGVNQGPSTTTDSFETVVPTDNLQQPQTYLVYFPEGKIVWNTQRLDNRLRYRVIYQYGYNTVPDMIRDLSSCVAARDVLLFWGSQLNVQEGITLFKRRLDERIFRLENKAATQTTAFG